MHHAVVQLLLLAFKEGAGEIHQPPATLRPFLRLCFTLYMFFFFFFQAGDHWKRGQRRLLVWSWNTGLCGSHFISSLYLCRPIQKYLWMKWYSGEVKKSQVGYGGNSLVATGSWEWWWPHGAFLMSPLLLYRGWIVSVRKVLFVLFFWETGSYAAAILTQRNCLAPVSQVLGL